jgi:hypothetical protein
MDTKLSSNYQINFNATPSKVTLKKVLIQESLVDKDATMPLVERLSEEVKIQDIYFGTGISNPNEISSGIPFDFLVYPLIANKIRNKLGSGHIHHLIADNHALLNNFDAKVVKRVASSYRTVVEDIAYKIGVKNYHVYLSSEISTDNNYRNLLEKVEKSSFSSTYAKYEATDIEYFRQTRNVLLKLGWKFKGNSNFDESKFDEQYANVFGDNIVSIYTVCGKRFSNNYQNVVPYTLSKNDIQIRFVISKDEDVIKKITDQKCSPQVFNMLKNHYSSLIRLFEETTGKIPQTAKTTWEKVQFINNFLTL